MADTTLVWPLRVCTRWPGECRRVYRLIGPDWIQHNVCMNRSTTHLRAGQRPQAVALHRHGVHGLHALADCAIGYTVHLIRPPPASDARLCHVPEPHQCPLLSSHHLLAVDARPEIVCPHATVRAAREEIGSACRRGQ